MISFSRLILSPLLDISFYKNNSQALQMQYPVSGILLNISPDPVYACVHDDPIRQNTDFPD